MLALVIVEGIVILLLVILVAGLLRSHADILRSLDRLERGTTPDPGVRLGPTRRATGSVPVDALTGLTLTGEARTVALRHSRGLVLAAFLSSGCTTCRPFWSSFDRELVLPDRDIRPVIVTKGAHEESPAELRRLAPTGVLTLLSSESWDAFRVPGTPYFQLIDTADGSVLGEGSAGSWPRLMELVRRALGDAGEPTLGRTTAERLIDSDEELRRAGIEPGDSTLYHRPEPR